MDLDIQSLSMGLVLLLCSSLAVTQRHMFMRPGVAQAFSSSTTASCCCGLALVLLGFGYSGWDLVPEPLRSILRPILGPVFSFLFWPLYQIV